MKSAERDDKPRRHFQRGRMNQSFPMSPSSSGNPRASVELLHILLEMFNPVKGRETLTHAKLLIFLDGSQTLVD